jgi:sulfatase-like protein
VGPVGRVARSGDEGPRQGHQPDRPAQHDEPALRLDDPALKSAPFFRGGAVPGARHEAIPPGGAWLSTRLLCAAALLPAFMVAIPGIYPFAWLILAAGIAMRLAPEIERRVPRVRRCLKWSFPVLLGSVVVVASLVFGREWFKQHSESRRPFPAGDSPNVLLIVLDTVRADHLSLYGYPRDTSRTLNRLAKRGISISHSSITMMPTPPTSYRIERRCALAWVRVRWQISRCWYGAGKRSTSGD